MNRIMKLSDIKTQNEAWEVADIWFQRAKSMNSIWQNENEPTERRLKAHKIFTHYGRVSLLIVQKLNNIPRKYKGYKEGGKNIF